MSRPIIVPLVFLVISVLLIGCGSDSSIDTSLFTVEELDGVQYIHNHAPQSGNFSGQNLELLGKIGKLESEKEEDILFDPVDAARLLTQRAASLKDAGAKTTRESAMAKVYASEVAVAVAEEAVQIHGGYGYTKEYPVERAWRDAKLCTIGEGTSEVQRLVIARSFLVATGRPGLLNWTLPRPGQGTTWTPAVGLLRTPRRSPSACCLWALEV